MATITSTPHLTRPTAVRRVAIASDRSRLLALLGPLALFVSGIFAWVDGLDGRASLANGSAAGIWWAAAQAALVVAVAGFALLTAEFGEQTGRGRLATIAVVVASFGAGATAAISLGRLTGILGDALPVALTAGGPLLVGLGLAVLLARLVAIGRLPLGSAALVALGGAVAALPWDLLPLAALVVLIGFGPLTQPATQPATQPTD